MSRARLFGTCVVALMLLGLTAIGARAADEPAPAKPSTEGRAPRSMQGGGDLMLLRLEVVSKDLNLSEDQTAKLKQIGDDAKKQMTDLRDSLKDASREDRRAKLEEAFKDVGAKVNGVLNEQQQARLKEIRLQLRGPSALSDPKIAEELKVTDDQKQSLKDQAGERRKAITAAIQDAGGREKAADKIKQILKDSNEKMEAVLTPEQREQFDKMKGKKIDLGDAAFGSFGGFGRRGSDNAKSESKPDAK